MPFYIPAGKDRADGVTLLPLQPIGSVGPDAPAGTPDPSGQLAVIGDPSGTKLEEAADSPEIERAEQCTAQHRFKTAYDNAINIISAIGRGTYLADTVGNIWRVLSTKVQSFRAGYADISIVSESISFDSPPDDFQVVPVELGIDILKHPRYSWALLPYATDNSTYVMVGDTDITGASIKESIVRLIQTYRDSPFFPSQNQINGLIQTNVLSQITNGTIDVQVPNPDCDFGTTIIAPPRWDGVTANKPAGNYQYSIVSAPVNISDPNDFLAIALAAAQEIISKLWRQEDTPYLVGYQVTWSQYFFQPRPLNPGGYIEDPTGIVPDYFIGTSGNLTDLARGDLGNPFGNFDTVAPPAPGDGTIFDDMASINPQSYSDDGTSLGSVNISWLRKADEVVYERTWFKIVHTWLGSPIGNWDRDLFTQNNRPQNANDFNLPY